MTPPEPSPCQVDGCIRPRRGNRALCGMHSRRLYKTGEVGPPGPLRYHDMDQRMHQPPKFCTVKGCGKKHKGRGYCATHWLRVRKTGDPGPAELLRRASGEGCVVTGGYIRVGKTPQHRLVWESHYGRYLMPYENVHHINGIRHDNRIENLEVWVTPQPSGQRPEDLVEWAIESYPDLVRSRLAALDAAAVTSIPQHVA